MKKKEEENEMKEKNKGNTEGTLEKTEGRKDERIANIYTV